MLLTGLLLTSGPARAQNQPGLRELPDLEYYTATQEGSKDTDWFHLVLEVGGLGRLDLGPDRETRGGPAAFGRLMANLGRSRTEVLHLDSTVVVPLRVDWDQESFDLDEERLMGHHRVWGQYGVGDLHEGSLGLDLSLDYRLDHTGGYTAIVRPELGPGGLFDQSVEVGTWLRRGLNTEGAFLLPLRYQWRRVDYLETAYHPLEFTTHRLSSGIGLKDYTDDTCDGWLELVGISWSHTGFDQGREHGGDLSPNAPVSIHPGERGEIDQIDLRLGHSEQLVGVPGDSVLIGANAFLGSSWLWNDARGQSASIFTFGYGFEGRFGNEEHHGTAGFSASRHAGWTPGGERLVANQHLEFIGEFISDKWGIGARHRSLFDWISHPEVQTTTPLPSPVPNYTLYSEWFMRMSAFELGAYHRANYGYRPEDPDIDPWDRTREWSHELGLFFRLAQFL